MFERRIVPIFPAPMLMQQADGVHRKLLFLVHVCLMFNIVPIFLGFWPIFGIVTALIILFFLHKQHNPFTAKAVQLTLKRLTVSVGMVISGILLAKYMNNISEVISIWVLICATQIVVSAVELPLYNMWLYEKLTNKKS